MESEEKILLNSLYDNINSYSEVIEVFQNLSKVFDDYFGCETPNGLTMCEWEFIIDYNTYCISAHRDLGLDMFYEFSKGVFKIEQYIGVDRDKILSILDNIEVFSANIVELFQRQIQLEFRSLINKKVGISNILVNELNDFLGEYIERNIQHIIPRVSEIKVEAEKLIIEELNIYDMNLWNMKKTMGKLWKDRNEPEEGVFLDKILSEREKFIDNVDSLKSKLQVILKEKFFNIAIEVIREAIGEKVSKKIIQFKVNLNKSMAKKITHGEKNKFMDVGYKNIKQNSVDLELYNICSEIFLIEYHYLKAMGNLSKSGFYAIKDEIKFSMDNIFISELYSPIYYIKTDEDFKSICILQKAKLNYIIYKFVIESIKRVKDKYYNGMVNMLLRKKNNIDKIYIFKAIDNCTGYVNYYNPEIIVEVYNKIKESYSGYKDEKGIDTHFSTILNSDYVDNNMDEEFFRQFMELGDEYESIINLNSYNSIESLEDKKNELHVNIKNFKMKLWDALEEEFILYFDSIFHAVGRNMEYVKRQAEYYVEKSNT